MQIIDVRNPFFYRTALFLVLVELLSLFGYLLPAFNNLGFFVIVLFAVALALLRFEYVLYLLLVELFVGSKGFLFYLAIDGTMISLRMALWLVVVGVWCGRFALLPEERRRWKDLLSQPIIRWTLLFFVVIVLVGVHGMFRNTFVDVFFDANGWLYFVLLFPFASIFRDSRHYETITTLLLASVVVSSVKALTILFVYAHDPLGGVFLPLYRWVRESGVGEVTAITPTFARVFFQSQIYTLIALFILLAQSAKEKKFNIQHSTFSILFLASILLSFSRSFWLAGLVTLLLFFLWQRFRGIGTMVVVSIASFLLIVGVMNFPYPRTQGGSFASLIERRATKTEEAGASSRWNLLPPLWKEVRAYWLFGAGFGKTVTYKSNDPRIVQSSAKGNSFYTTYAFEWGYLDLLLKFGLLGLFVYGIVLWKIGKKLFRHFDTSTLRHGFFFGFLALLLTNIFSPYLNHPLGIGYLLLLICISVYAVSSPAESKA